MSHLEFAEIAIDQIIPGPRQPGDGPDDEAFDELTASIRSRGLLQPVVVRERDNNRYELVAGARRWRACRAAGLATVPAFVRDGDRRRLPDGPGRGQVQRPDGDAVSYQQLLEEFAATREAIAACSRAATRASQLAAQPANVPAEGRARRHRGPSHVLPDLMAPVEPAPVETSSTRSPGRAEPSTSSASPHSPDAPRHRVRGVWRLMLAATVAEEDAEHVAQAPVVPIRDIVRRFQPYLRGRRLALLATILLTSVVPVVETAEIWLFKMVIDDILVPRRFNLFVPVALAYVGLTLAASLISFVEGMLSVWLSQRVLIDLRTAVFDHVQRLSPDFFERRRLGDLVARVTGDTSAIEDFLVSGSQTLANNVVSLLVFTVALFVLDWRLALVSFVVTPVFWVVARYFSRRIKTASREKRRRSGSISVVVEESLRNVPLVQAYNREQWEHDRFRRANEAKYRAELTSARLRGLFSPVVDAVELVGGLVVIGFGTWQLSRGALTMGSLLVFMALLTQIYSPIRGLTKLTNSAYSASAGAERVIELLNEQPRVTDAPSAVPLRVARPSLQFHDVCFSYPGESASGDGNRPALEHVSFRVEPGEVLALVGPSGAGKSTIARLLLRSFDPTSGRIMLGGEDLRGLTLQSLRASIAVLLQETLVFDGTVRDNIAYGRVDATDSQIVAAARAADAHEFIVGLPDGYDTRIGERGARLSGGQRQRLAIARAMVRDAPVLLLDEPTTGLDAESGQRMLEPLRRLMAGRTSIVISHNLLTVRDATTILVLDQGRVVEAGTHTELLSRGGLYARLHRLSGLGEPQRHLAVVR